MDHIQQQAGLQREQLEAEIGKIKEDESFLRDHLSISVKVPQSFVEIYCILIILMVFMVFDFLCFTFCDDTFYLEHSHLCL